MEALPLEGWVPVSNNGKRENRVCLRTYGYPSPAHELGLASLTCLHRDRASLGAQRQGGRRFGLGSWGPGWVWPRVLHRSHGPAGAVRK